MTINNVYNLSICILAGGQGKRMKSELPKVCVCFKGIPMIVHVIRVSLKLNASKIIIITGKFNEIIQNTIKKWLSNTDFEKLRFVAKMSLLSTKEKGRKIAYIFLILKNLTDALSKTTGKNKLLSLSLTKADSLSIPLTI